MTGIGVLEIGTPDLVPFVRAKMKTNNQTFHLPDLQRGADGTLRGYRDNPPPGNEAGTGPAAETNGDGDRVATGARLYKTSDRWLTNQNQ